DGIRDRNVTGVQTCALPIYLALGDSYTQGESVCESCSFPMQLMQRIAKQEKVKVVTEVVAQSGWTSSDLISGLRSKQLGSDFDRSEERRVGKEWRCRRWGWS